MSHRFHRYDSAANPVQPPWHCRKLSLSICANFFASDGICFAISPPGVSETSENELRGKNDQQVLWKRIRHMIFLPNHPKSFHEFLVHDCFRLLNLWWLSQPVNTDSKEVHICCTWDAAFFLCFLSTFFLKAKFKGLVVLQLSNPTLYQRSMVSAVSWGIRTARNIGRFSADASSSTTMTTNWSEI